MEIDSTYTINTLNTLPLGSALLNRTSPTFNDKLKTLNQIQEIIDDFALESSKQVEITSQVAILYAKEEETSRIPQVVQEFAELAQEFFEVSLLELSLLENFSGSFGAFNARFLNGNVVEFSQAVLFVYEEELLRFRGVYNVADFQSPNALLQTLQNNIGIYNFKEMIRYKEDYCQYHKRREKHCAKCTDVCPTFGVGANDSLMELVFSHIDCTACGACVGVCPTNCLEYEEMPKEGLEEIIDFYKSQKIFLCSLQDYTKLSAQNVVLPEDVMPMILPNILMLNENDLLTMVQTSGNALLVFGEDLSAPMRFLNNITQQIYQENAVILVNVESLEMSAHTLPKIDSYLYRNRYNKPFRESFAQRLQFMIKEKDFGLAKSIVGDGAPVFYGDLQVDSKKCTLCLSCVGACNVNAIFARSDDFSLRFNASLCTTCGYCVDSCPENVMQLHRDGIRLSADYFKSREIAKDEPFLCVECGQAFSTKKSVEKVVTMLSGAFQNDSKKLKTLQCCPDCKVKVMFGETNA